MKPPAHTDAQERQSGDEVEVRRGAVDADEQQDARRRDEHAAGDDGPGADARRQPGAGRGTDGDGGGQRQEPDTGVEGAEAEDELELLGDEEHRAERRQEHEHHRQ